MEDCEDDDCTDEATWTVTDAEGNEHHLCDTHRNTFILATQKAGKKLASVVPYVDEDDDDDDAEEDESEEE